MNIVILTIYSKTYKKHIKNNNIKRVVYY